MIVYPLSDVLDSLAVGCRFEPAVGGTSEALRVAVLPIREGKCLPGVLAPNGQQVRWPAHIRRARPLAVGPAAGIRYGR